MRSPVALSLRKACASLLAAAALLGLGAVATGCSIGTAGASDKSDSGLFNSSVVHEITVSFAQEDYEAMMETYQQRRQGLGRGHRLNRRQDLQERGYEAQGELLDHGARRKGSHAVHGP